MTAPERVFITGCSALTACGQTAEETWQSVLDGKTGIAEITNHDLSSWPARLGGELKSFQPAKMLPDKKLMKVISRQDVMGIHAAMQAVDDSGLLPYRDSLSEPDLFNDRTAVFAGSPGNKYYQQYDFLPLLAKTGNMQEFAAHLFEEVHPMWLLKILPNNVLAYTGISCGFKGYNHNITNHASGGAQAILEAFHAIQNGQADRAVVVAYDVGVEPQALFYYDKLGVISSNHLKPFDKAHDGTILAEGAAAIVLESERSAKARGARCLGEMAGGFAISESSGLFSIEQDGASLSKLIDKTLRHLNLKPADIDMLVAHGNGNVRSDETEARAIEENFGRHTVPVTAFKWATGHTLCASGILDTVLSLKAMQNSTIPGIASLDTPAPSCQDLNIQSAHRSLPDINHMMLINRGFAGMNVCWVVKSCD